MNTTFSEMKKKIAECTTPIKRKFEGTKKIPRASKTGMNKRGEWKKREQ